MTKKRSIYLVGLLKKQSTLDKKSKVSYTKYVKRACYWRRKMKNKISQLRKQHKITQEELANEVGVTRQTITSIETGKYIASLPLAFKIAKFFDMSIEEIFSIEEDD